MDAHAALVRLDVSQGRGADAEKRLRALLESQPKNAVARNLLGELKYTSKSYAEAAELFAQAIRDQPRWSVPYRNLANCRGALGDRDGLLAAYAAGVTATGYALDLSMELASLYEQQGKAEEAIAVYDEVLKRRPREDAAANNLAMLLVTYRTDGPSLERARELTESFANSDTGAFLDTSGWVRLKTGDVDRALHLLERAVNRTPQSQVFRYHLAMAQIQAGMHDKARDNLETVLKDDDKFSGRDAARAALDSLKRRSS